LFGGWKIGGLAALTAWHLFNWRWFGVILAMPAKLTFEYVNQPGVGREASCEYHDNGASPCFAKILFTSLMTLFTA
jgi:hypothetical protein